MLEGPTQQSSQGRHSDPGCSVPPFNLAKGGTLTQATLSHQAKMYTLTQAAAVQLREDTLTHAWGSHPTAQLMWAL